MQSLLTKPVKLVFLGWLIKLHMNNNKQNAKIIFGLKVKQLRMERNFKPKAFSEAVGLSISYLNEIEKGKKYPKKDKISQLAKVLEVSEAYLTSTELNGRLSPVVDLLQSNFLNDLPLDLFGIELYKVVEIIASSPIKVGAFISTLVELSRNYALSDQNFYFGALRAYMELHNNYFADIEKAAAQFVEQHQLPTDKNVPVDQLAHLLASEYGYQIMEEGLKAYPELDSIRSVYVPHKKQLLLNANLNDMQKAFQFGKELGFNYLKLAERANTSKLLNADNFEAALNHFRAGYFSAAILINQQRFITDVRSLFQLQNWQPEAFLQLLENYRATPEMIFQRFTNVLPNYFNLKKIFFLRFIHHKETNKFQINKELHLSRRHQPHGNGLFEHYCRRWVAISSLKDLEQMQAQHTVPSTLISVQRSKYFGTADEYLCFTISRLDYPSPIHNISVTLGIAIDENLKKTVQFLDDPAIPSRMVNNTCERCAIENCQERVAAASVIDARKKRKAMQQALDKILKL